MIRGKGGPRGKPTVREQTAKFLRTMKRHEAEVVEAREVEEIARTLTEEEIGELLKLTTDDTRAMQQITRAIGSGGKARNAQAYLTLLRTKLDFTREKPQQKVNVDGALEIVVNTIAAEYRPAVEGTTVALPASIARVALEDRDKEGEDT